MKSSPLTEWNLFRKHPNADEIATGLDVIPPHWALTPLREKRPYREDWQNEIPLSHVQIAALILNGESKISAKGNPYRLYASGFGIRTGDISGGILAIDVDGPDAGHLLDMISGGSLPDTVAFTSGKKGRKQLLFQIPSEYRERLKDFIRKPLREWGEFSSSQDLDFRYNGCQSCLPPSWHPETGSYRWLTSPTETEIANAPDWLIELVTEFAETEEKERLERDRIQAEQQAKRAEKRSQHGFNGIAVPLEVVLAKSNRQALEYGAGQGERDNRGAALVRDLLGAADALDQLGIEYEGEPLTLLEEYGSRCSPPLTTRDINRLWRSAQRKSPTAALPDDAILACVGAWKYHHGDRSGNSGYRSGFAALGDHLINWVKDAKKSLYKFQVKGHSEAKPLTPSTFEDDPNVWIYEEGDRLSAWVDGVSGYKVILDQSDTGTGKSHTVGETNPRDFGSSRIWYISTDHRNPTTDTIRANFTDLEGRHGGLTRDQFGKYRRQKAGETLAVAGNCVRNDAITELRNKNISGADSADQICINCPVLEQCKSGKTHIDYRYQRASKLDQKNGPELLSAHPASLPSADEYDYSADILFIDEAENAIRFSKQIPVRAHDVEQTIAALAIEYPDLLASFSPTLSGLLDLLRGKIKQPNRYGFSHHSLIDLIPPPVVTPDESLSLSEFENLTDEIKAALDTTDEYGVSLADLPPQIRKQFADNSAEATEKIKAIRKIWLSDFLGVLAGQRGHLSLCNGELTIVVPDERMHGIINAAKSVVCLDATLKREKLALILGIDPDDILVTKQREIDHRNIERIQIATMGRMGLNRGADQEKRLADLLGSLKNESSEKGEKLAVCEFKRFAAEGDLRWFIESRGANDFQDVDTLIITGTPCPSLRSLEAEFAILHGYTPTNETTTVHREIKLSGGALPDGTEAYFESNEAADPKFAEFVRAASLAAMKQAEGRLRANRRPDKKLKIIYIADFALDVPVKLVRAVDICAEAGTKGQRLQAAIFNHIRKLKDVGRLTRDGLAEALSISTGRISQLIKKLGYKDFSDFKASSLLLIKALLAKVTASKTPPKTGWMGERLASLAKTDVEKFLAEAIAFSRVIHKREGSDRLAEFLQSLPAEVSELLLSELIGILPLSIQRSLLRETGQRLYRLKVNAADFRYPTW